MRVKNAPRHAQDLFVDGVGDLVRDIAHRVAARGQREPQQALLLGHVEQLVLDPVAAGAGIDHAADHQVILVERAPGRVADLAAARGALDHVGRRQAAELAGAVEVGGDDRGDVGLRRRAGRPGRASAPPRSAGRRRCRRRCRFPGPAGPSRQMEGGRQAARPASAGVGSSASPGSSGGSVNRLGVNAVSKLNERLRATGLRHGN